MALRPGKRVWEMAFFWSELGLDMEMRAAHPHQKFQGNVAVTAPAFSMLFFCDLRSIPSIELRIISHVLARAH